MYFLIIFDMNDEYNASISTFSLNLKEMHWFSSKINASSYLKNKIMIQSNQQSKAVKHVMLLSMIIEEALLMNRIIKPWRSVLGENIKYLFYLDTVTLESLNMSSVSS